MSSLNLKDDYVTREAILSLLSDEELARVNGAEGGPKLVQWDEYIDLNHLNQGVQHLHPTTTLSMRDVLPRRAVGEATWTKICARLVAGYHAR